MNIISYKYKRALEAFRPIYDALNLDYVWERARTGLDGIRQIISNSIAKIAPELKYVAVSYQLGIEGIFNFIKELPSKATVSAFTKATKSATALAKKVNVFSKIFEALSDTIKRMGDMIKRVFVFSLITSGLRSVRTQMAAYLNLNEQFTTALRRLQGVFLTAFQPIYDVIVPALTTFIRILSRAIAAVTQFFASLFGTTGKKAQSSAKALYEEANALKAAAGSAAAAQTRTLARFLIGIMTTRLLILGAKRSAHFWTSCWLAFRNWKKHLRSLRTN